MTTLCDLLYGYQTQHCTNSLDVGTISATSLWCQLSAKLWIDWALLSINLYVSQRTTVSLCNGLALSVVNDPSFPVERFQFLNPSATFDCGRKMYAAIAIRRIGHNWVFQRRKLLVPIRINEWNFACLPLPNCDIRNLFRVGYTGLHVLSLLMPVAVGSTSHWYGWSQVDGLDSSDEVAVLESITN